MSKECILSIFIKIFKRLSEAKPPFEILRFDIRYSAVRCSDTVKIHMRCMKFRIFNLNPPSAERLTP